MANKNSSWIWVVLVIAAVLLYSKYGKLPSFAVLPPEDQFKSEYYSQWSDSTSSHIFSTTGSIGYGTGNLIRDGNIVYTNTGGDIVVGNGEIVFDNQNYKGQEVLIYLTGKGYNAFTTSSGGIAGGCSITGAGLRCIREPNSYYTTCDETVVKYIPNTFDTSIYSIYVNGIKVNELNVGDTFHPRVSCSTDGTTANAFLGFIHFVGSKAQFDCDLSPNEVWIRERFTQQLNISDLAYIPTKFCNSGRPFILRDLNLGETTVRREEGIEPLNRGETIPSRALTGTEVLEVSYATFLVAGLGEPCAFDEVKENINGAWACRKFLEPLVLTVQCQKDADCPTPLKNSCPNYFIGCQSNTCKYDDTQLNSSVCRNEIITIIHDIQLQDVRVFVNVSGSTTFKFAHPYNDALFSIGNKQFTTSTKYTCAPPASGETIRPPVPEPGCYHGEAAYNGQTLLFTDGQQYALNPHIKLTYYDAGKVTRNDVTGLLDIRYLYGVYYFTITDPLSLNIEDTNEILLNSVKDVSLSIVNNMPEGDVLLKVAQQVKSTNTILPEQIFNLHLLPGNNIVTFPLVTSNLGINQITVNSFYKIAPEIENVYLMPSNGFIVNYKVVTEFSGSQCKENEVTLINGICKAVIQTCVDINLNSLCDLNEPIIWADPTTNTPVCADRDSDRICDGVESLFCKDTNKNSICDSDEIKWLSTYCIDENGNGICDGVENTNTVLCDAIYTPVCDPSTNITYPNKCFANGFGVTSTIQDACVVPPTIIRMDCATGAVPIPAGYICDFETGWLIKRDTVYINTTIDCRNLAPSNGYTCIQVGEDWVWTRTQLVDIDCFSRGCPQANQLCQGGICVQESIKCPTQVSCSIYGSDSVCDTTLGICTKIQYLYINTTQIIKASCSDCPIGSQCVPQNNTVLCVQSTTTTTYSPTDSPIDTKAILIIGGIAIGVFLLFRLFN